VGRDVALSGKEFHNCTVTGNKDMELVCRRHFLYYDSHHYYGDYMLMFLQ